jgi:hypothetical protein
MEGLFTFKRKNDMFCIRHVNHRQHPTCPSPGGCKKHLQ